MAREGGNLFGRDAIDELPESCLLWIPRYEILPLLLVAAVRPARLQRRIA